MDENGGRGRRRQHHLRVPVFPEERALIEQNAKNAGRSVAAYLREIGQGYKVQGVLDFQLVGDLVRVNGDMGRLGGLLKLWLSDDPRTAKFGEAHVRVLLQRIEEGQLEMRQIMQSVMHPRKSD